MSPRRRLQPREVGIGRLFETTRDAVIVAEARSQEIVLWNPAAEALFGYSQDEAIGMLVEELVPPELKDNHRMGISRYAERRSGPLVEARKPVELPAVCKGGEAIDIELVFAPIDGGPDDGVYIAAFLRDVTERSRLQKEAADALAHLNLILQSTGEGIYGIDTEGICTFANFACAEMLGYRPEEMVGKNMHLLIHHTKEDGTPYPVEECPIFRSFRVGRGCHVDDEVMWRRDGVPVPVRYSAFPIIDQGVVSGAVVSMADMTQRRRLEQSLRDANARLNQAYETEREAVERLKALDQLKNEFVAMVAHDLKSPMTVIGGLASLMESRWDELDDAKKTEFLGLISSNVNKLADLTENVLQVARIEANEISYEVEPFDLLQLARKTAADVVPVDGSRTVDITAPDELPPVLGDEQRVWQVLMNLYSNALKFSPPGSPVEVELLHTDDDMVQVNVRDHGGGIRPEEMGKLFGKFSRLTQSGDTDVKGTGLGLFICKRMIEEQGGRIWAESTLGEGSTFSFTLPIAPAGS
ncbi:MAG TPA: PAS domain-containing sensor histidine kinase [Actinomycetota bacterium]|nr:PAS domain-containing sensor histidine kinase [Actinomycetota bacterium]